MNDKQLKYVELFIEQSLCHLTGAEIRVYLWMLSQTDEKLRYCGSYRTLSGELNLSENGVRFSLGSLVRMGLVKRMFRKKRGEATTYQLLKPKQPKGDLKSLRHDAQMAPAAV